MTEHEREHVTAGDIKNDRKHNTANIWHRKWHKTWWGL